MLEMIDELQVEEEILLSKYKEQGAHPSFPNDFFRKKYPFHKYIVSS